MSQLEVVVDADHESKLRSGWVLYHNEEGFPYFFNENSGESEWARVTDESYYYVYGYAQGEEGPDKGLPQAEDSGDSDEEGNADDDEEGELDGDIGDSGSDSSDESEDSNAGEGYEDRKRRLLARRVQDALLEKQFKEYLASEQGQEAAEEEVYQVERRVRRRAGKKARTEEREYVRQLVVSKKTDGEIPQGAGAASSSSVSAPALLARLGLLGPRLSRQADAAFVRIAAVPTQWAASALSWMTGAPADAGAVGAQRAGRHRRGGRSGAGGTGASKYDDFNRETKHRGAGAADAEVGAGAGAGAAAGVGMVPASGYSYSSDDLAESSDDDVSLSSDDSDIQEVDKPLFADLPPWLSVAAATALLHRLLRNVGLRPESLPTAVGAATESASAVRRAATFLGWVAAAAVQGGVRLLADGAGFLFEQASPMTEEQGRYRDQGVGIGSRSRGSQEGGGGGRSGRKEKGARRHRREGKERGTERAVEKARETDLADAPPHPEARKKPARSPGGASGASNSTSASASASSRPAMESPQKCANLPLPPSQTESQSQTQKQTNASTQQQHFPANMPPPAPIAAPTAATVASIAAPAAAPAAATVAPATAPTSPYAAPTAAMQGLHLSDRAGAETIQVAVATGDSDL
ncbi:hypothetical protein B484DRAFT_85548 [Ochromonadaceae sp. CCMP2298]|nr:hypothetical protein B484DRAFT_85548 [Ochromonadaceae sp. CCMP2298]